VIASYVIPAQAGMTTLGQPNNYMTVCGIRFIYWDQLYYFQIPEGQTYQVGDLVIVKTPTGNDLGKIETFFNGDVEELKKEEEIFSIIKQAEKNEVEDLQKINQKTSDYLKFCRQLIKKHKLEMKLVDVHLSLDGHRITYAFIADGRVDFRELVKELIKKYNKAIRLQQLGVRDEVKFFGDIGPCGRLLCCQTYLQELGNVTSEFAKDQQVASRGAERLSGPCGRLKCCLAYEEKVYQDLNKKFPPLGSKFKTKEGEGIVVGYHTLRGAIDVNLGTEEEKKIIEVKI